MEEGTGPGQKDKHRRAEVRDPAGEEDPGRRAAGGQTGIDPHVVDGHQDHDRATDEVDRRDAGEELETCGPTELAAAVKSRMG